MPSLEGDALAARLGRWQGARLAPARAGLSFSRVCVRPNKPACHDAAAFTTTGARPLLRRCAFKYTPANYGARVPGARTRVASAHAHSHTHTHQHTHTSPPPSTRASVRAGLTFGADAPRQYTRSADQPHRANPSAGSVRQRDLLINHALAQSSAYRVPHTRPERGIQVTNSINTQYTHGLDARLPVCCFTQARTLQ